MQDLKAVLSGFKSNKVNARSVSTKNPDTAEVTRADTTLHTPSVDTDQTNRPAKIKTVPTTEETVLGVLKSLICGFV